MRATSMQGLTLFQGRCQVGGLGARGVQLVLRGLELILQLLNLGVLQWEPGQASRRRQVWDPSKYKHTLEQFMPRASGNVPLNELLPAKLQAHHARQGGGHSSS